MSDDTSQQSTLRTDGGISSIEIGFPAIAFGLHAILALALIPFAWDALQAGNFPLVGSLALLSTLILILGADACRLCLLTDILPVVKTAGSCAWSSDNQQ